MKKNITAIFIALLMAMSIAGCGNSGAGPGYVPYPDGVAAQPFVKDPVVENPVVEEPVVEDPVVEPDEVDTMPVTEVPDTRTSDEKLIDQIVSVCSVQATAETDFKACVVDIRTAENPYDIVWDYGSEYDELAYYEGSCWDRVFDIEYYKDAFPMLAMLYHDDAGLLKMHFATVGIHEGRQGSAAFNVKAFMEACPASVRDTFGDNYACYYLYYMNSAEVDRSIDVSGRNYPKQMTAVMTAVQKEEFDKINTERERLGRGLLVFDSELAAVANYRAWINADGNWAAHDWAEQHNSELWDIVHKIGGDTFSENTTSRFRDTYNAWYNGYYQSKPHHEAMINDAYNFVGDSNVYACDNTLEQYSSWKSDTRLVHFDVFMGTLDTALHSN